MPKSAMAQLPWVAPLVVIYYSFVLWVVYKFYKALARVGDELSEIKQALQDRPTQLTPGSR